jgi:hypothetical protein
MPKSECIYTCVAAALFLTLTTRVHAKPVSKKITARATESAVDTALDALTEPENQRKLSLILSSPAITQSARSITLSVVEAIFDSLKKHVQLDTDSFANDFDTSMRKHVAPGAAFVTRSIVSSALASTLSDKNAKRSEAFAKQSTHGMVQGLAQGVHDQLGPAIAHALAQDRGPAAPRVVEHQLIPAIARGLNNPEVQAAISATTASIARNIVRGADAGIDSAQLQNAEQGEVSSLNMFGVQLARGYAIALFFVFALATSLLVLVLLLVRSNRGQRRLATQWKHREEAFLALLEQLEAEHPSSKASLRDLIRDQLHAT